MIPWRRDHDDLLIANGAVATYKSHALRIWCLEMAPKDKEKRTELELNDVLFLHDQDKESSYWEKHTHSMQHLAVWGRGKRGVIDESMRMRTRRQIFTS